MSAPVSPLLRKRQLYFSEALFFTMNSFLFEEVTLPMQASDFFST